MRRLLITPLAAMAVAGCGGSSPEHEAVSAATARKEIAQTRAALRDALASYRRGARARAVDQVSEAYASHFEEVEEPLGAKDGELKERLEHAIAEDLRADMKAGRPAAAVQGRVDAIAADLDRADAALR